MAHTKPLCADLIPKEQSAPTDFGKNVLPLHSSSTRVDFSSSPKTPIEGTKGFASYLGDLLEHQIIGEPQLIQFIEGLERGELINPISKDEARVSTASQIHRETLQEYLDKSSLNQEKLLNWSKAILEKRARIQVSRGETQKETKDLYQNLEFHPVKRPAHFEMKFKDKFKLFKNKKLVTLTYPIEVQSTPVTQKQWVEIMGENPSAFTKGESSVVLNFHGKGIELQPDHPVERVTWWSALVFANRLSEKQGLPPVYDLSGITWNPSTRPENGTLAPKWVSDQNDEIRIYANGKSHDPSEGDIYYQTEGYRLPTFAEQTYMLQGGGEKYLNEADLKNHAWYLDNAYLSTHPVGLLQPMVIDGRKFYDLYGDVWEWGWDHMPSKGVKKYGGENPILFFNLKTMEKRSAVGGGFIENPFWFQPLISNEFTHLSKRFDVGFRLVRTIESTTEN